MFVFSSQKRAFSKKKKSNPKVIAFHNPCFLLQAAAAGSNGLAGGLASAARVVRHAQVHVDGGTHLLALASLHGPSLLVAGGLLGPVHLADVARGASLNKKQVESLFPPVFSSNYLIALPLTKHQHNIIQHTT